MGFGNMTEKWGHGQNRWKAQGCVTGFGDVQWEHSTGHGNMGRMEKGTGMWLQGVGTGQGDRLCGQGDIGDALGTQGHSDMGCRDITPRPGQNGDMALGTRV